MNPPVRCVNAVVVGCGECACAEAGAAVARRLGDLIDALHDEFRMEVSRNSEVQGAVRAAVNVLGGPFAGYAGDWWLIDLNAAPPLDVEDPQPTSQELREDAHDARVEVLRTAHEDKQ